MADVNDGHMELINAIMTIVDGKLDSYSTTSSLTGVVTEDPVGFKCKVNINNEIYECTLAEHLHSWIQKDDVVIVQDLYNNKQRLMVTGKTGQLQSSPSLVFFNPKSERLESGVDGVFDSSGDKIGYASVGKEIDNG